MPAKPLTKDQLKESAKLKDLFKAWQDAMRRAGSKVSQDDVADRLGIGQSAFSQYLNGKIPLNPDFAAKISGLIGAKVGDFSPTIARQINSLTVAIPSYDPPALLPADTVEIPQFDVSGSMGHGVILRDQPGVIRDWHVTEEWIKRNIPNNTGINNLCIVTGFGVSMQPLYNPGDPLIVDIGVTRADVDGVYFFRVGEEGFIKHLQRVPGEGLVVISENKMYKDWLVKPDMDFQVLGRVLTAWRSTLCF